MSHLRWVLCSLTLILSPIAASTVERRGMIDIGSGSVKLMVSDVDTESNQVIKKVYENVLAVSMQGHLNRSTDNKFDKVAVMECLAALWLSKIQARTYHAEKVSAIATAAFRNAKNNNSTARFLTRATKIPISIIEQREEARLGYLAAKSKVQTEGRVVVWDLGGGSMQISYIDPDTEEMFLYEGSLAAHTYKEQVLGRVKKITPLPETSPNPMTTAEAAQAIFIAQTEARNVPKNLRHVLAGQKVTVLGIDAIHNYAIAGQMGVQNHYTKKGLHAHISTMIDKSDEELGGGPFASLLLTDALLVYGFMDELNIHDVRPVKATISEGALISPQYWK